MRCRTAAGATPLQELLVLFQESTQLNLPPTRYLLESPARTDYEVNRLDRQ
jgi:hypothetical protein